MDDLVTWLGQQLDEHERLARELDHMPACGFSGECDCLLAERVDRALRRVDADRRILDLHADQHECTDHRGTDYPYVGCETVRLLTLPHADRSGYREEWRPA